MNCLWHLPSNLGDQQRLPSRKRTLEERKGIPRRKHRANKGQAEKADGACRSNGGS